MGLVDVPRFTVLSVLLPWSPVRVDLVGMQCGPSGHGAGEEHKPIEVRVESGAPQAHSRGRPVTPNYRRVSPKVSVSDPVTSFPPVAPGG